MRLRSDEAGGYATALESLGCHAVRTEGHVSGDTPVLRSILGLLSRHDELLAPKLEHLGNGPSEILQIIERLDRSGAVLRLLEPPLTSDGLEGDLLRSVLKAAAALESASGRRRMAPEHRDEIINLARTGVPKATIAKRLGLSRMTVWRTLKAEDGKADPPA